MSIAQVGNAASERIMVAPRHPTECGDVDPICGHWSACTRSPSGTCIRPTQSNSVDGWTTAKACAKIALWLIVALFLSSTLADVSAKRAKKRA